MTLQNTTHPFRGVIQDKTQILIQVYPNVTFNIPCRLNAVVCMGLWSGQSWGGCSWLGFTDCVHQSKQPFFWDGGRMSPFPCREVCSASGPMSYFQLVFPLLPVLCRGAASKDVSAHEQTHLILKLCFWKGIDLQN